MDRARLSNLLFNVPEHGDPWPVAGYHSLLKIYGSLVNQRGKWFLCCCYLVKESNDYDWRVLSGRRKILISLCVPKKIECSLPCFAVEDLTRETCFFSNSNCNSFWWLLPMKEKEKKKPDTENMADYGSPNDVHNHQEKRTKNYPRSKTQKKKRSIKRTVRSPFRTPFTLAIETTVMEPALRHHAKSTRSFQHWCRFAIHVKRFPFVFSSFVLFSSSSVNCWLGNP